MTIESTLEIQSRMERQAVPSERIDVGPGLIEIVARKDDLLIR